MKTISKMFKTLFSYFAGSLPFDLPYPPNRPNLESTFSYFLNFEIPGVSREKCFSRKFF